MLMRKDPMSAAAEAVNAIERICMGQAPADGAAADAHNVTAQALVCTVGKLDVHPNQVPGGGGWRASERCFGESGASERCWRPGPLCWVNCTADVTHYKQPLYPARIQLQSKCAVRKQHFKVGRSAQ